MSWAKKIHQSRWGSPADIIWTNGKRRVSFVGWHNRITGGYDVEVTWSQKFFYEDIFGWEQHRVGKPARYRFHCSDESLAVFNKIEDPAQFDTTCWYYPRDVTWMLRDWVIQTDLNCEQIPKFEFTEKELINWISKTESLDHGLLIANSLGFKKLARKIKSITSIVEFV